MAKLVPVYAFLVCKIFGPKIQSCKFFDKFQVWPSSINMGSVHQCKFAHVFQFWILYLKLHCWLNFKSSGHKSNSRVSSTNDKKKANLEGDPRAKVLQISKKADVCNLGIIICRSFEPGGECSVGAGSEYIISLLISSVNIFHYDGTQTASVA